MSTAPAPAPHPSPGIAESTSTRTGLSRIAAALTYRDFRVLWCGAFLSTIGTWMQKVAQNWLVLTITGSSAFFLGLDSFLGELPILLLTVVGGVFADRHDRRQLLLASQYIQMGAAFSLAALVYWDVVHIWHVLALSVVTGLAQAFGGPAYQSLLPSLVSKDHVPNAIAFNSIQFNLARVIGPLFAGAALAAFGMVACFGLNGLSFLAVIVAILSLHVRHIPSGRHHAHARGIPERLRVRAKPSGIARAGRARLRGHVPRQPAPHVPPALRTECVARRRDAIHPSDVERRRRCSNGCARRRLARPLSAHGPECPVDSDRLRRTHGALRDDEVLLGECDSAFCSRSVHGDGVRHALVTGPAQRAQRDAWTCDESVHGRVSGWDAPRQPGRGLARHAHQRYDCLDA